MLLTLTAASGDPLELVTAADIMTELHLDDEPAVEVVRLFRRASAESRPRGGHLGSATLTVERVHDNYPAAVAYALSMRRELRDIAMRSPLSVACVLGPTSWSYTAASCVALGPTRILGLRTIQTYRIAGTLV